MSATVPVPGHSKPKSFSSFLRGIRQILKSYRALNTVNPEQGPELLMQHLEKIFERNSNSDWKNGGKTVTDIHLAYETCMRLHRKQLIDDAPQLLLQTVEAILSRDKIQTSDLDSDLDSNPELEEGGRKRAEKTTGAAVGVQNPKEIPNFHSPSTSLNNFKRRRQVFKCPVCPLEFEEKAQWKRHVKDHRKTREKEKDGEGSSAKRSIPKVEAGTEAKEEDCVIVAEYSASGKNSKQDFKSPGEIPSSSGAGSGSGSSPKKIKICHKCPVCGLLLYCFETLRRHALTHVSSAIVLCRICNQYFVDQDKFKDHVEKVHMREKPQQQKNQEPDKHVIKDENSTVETQSNQDQEEYGDDEEFEMPKLEPMVDLDTHFKNLEPQNSGKSCNFPNQSNNPSTKESDQVLEPLLDSDLDSELKPPERNVQDFEQDPSPRSSFVPRRPPKRHECPYCSKLWIRPSQLMDHIRTHTGERPFPCAICQMSFKAKSALRTHMKRHERRL